MLQNKLNESGHTFYFLRTKVLPSGIWVYVPPFRTVPYGAPPGGVWHGDPRCAGVYRASDKVVRARAAAASYACDSNGKLAIREISLARPPIFGKLDEYRENIISPVPGQTGEFELVPYRGRLVLFGLMHTANLLLWHHAKHFCADDIARVYDRNVLPSRAEGASGPIPTEEIIGKLFLEYPESALMPGTKTLLDAKKVMFVGPTMNFEGAIGAFSPELIPIEPTGITELKEEA